MPWEVCSLLAPVSAADDSPGSGANEPKFPNMFQRWLHTQQKHIVSAVVVAADVVIGNRVTIGCGSAVMPGCVINDDAVIGVSVC